VVTGRLRKPPVEPRADILIIHHSLVGHMYVLSVSASFLR
jgi:hypothetical protein